MPVYTTQGLEQTSQSFEAFPKGEYNLIVCDISDGPFDNGQGHKVDVTWEVVDGEYKGRKMFDLIALSHSNPEWAKGTQGRLDAMCAVAGLTVLDSFSQLLNTVVRAKVYIEKSKDEAYSDKNKIDLILGAATIGAVTTQMAMTPATVAKPAAAAVATKPTMEAPAAVAAKPAAAPVATAAAPVAVAAKPAVVAQPTVVIPATIEIKPVKYSDGTVKNQAVDTATGEIVAVGQPGYVEPVENFDESDIPF